MINSYHAHIYFDSDTREKALSIRSELAFLSELSQYAESNAISVGRMHDNPIGPHTKPQFQVSFTHQAVSEILLTLIEDRNGLNVLIHPNSENELKDHTENVMWLGNPIPLDLEKL